MSKQIYHPGSIIRKIAYTAFFALATVAIWAQDQSETLVHHGHSEHEAVVRNATVVYVEGNDLVLKLENGKVEHMVVPDSDKFTIDGKVISVYDLKPGTRLTQSITTTTTPRYVSTVRTLKGKIWHVNAPRSVIVTLPDGKNHQYIVPSHATFTVNGQPKTVFDLRKGMTFEATIISEEPQTIVFHGKSFVGQAPPPVLPPTVGLILIEPFSRHFSPLPVPEDEPVPAQVASTESYPEVLPKTGSLLPLSGLLGVLAVAASLGMERIRRKSEV